MSAQQSPSAPDAAPPRVCPVHAAVPGLRAAVPPGPRYRRPLGLLHHRGVRQEIAALHAERDCERIVFLLSTYEFPFDMTRALEVALFHTFGSRSVSRLLDRTGQFQHQGQKRYDDTNLLIAQFIESGWQAPLGASAR